MVIAPKEEEKKDDEKKLVATAVLSTTARAKARERRKESGKLDAQALCAALMHDCMEDCGVTKIELIERDAQARLFHEEEPVAAPGHVTMHAAKARHIQRHLLAIAVGRHIAHAHRAVVVQGG